MPTDNPVEQYQRRMAIFVAIRRERQHQDRKYGNIEDRRITLRDYIEITRAELDEASTALFDGDLDNTRLELLQVAAVAVAALEAHGLVVRPESE